MLQLAITLLVLALDRRVARLRRHRVGLCGDRYILFFVFIVLFLISAVASALRGRPPV